MCCLVPKFWPLYFASARCCQLGGTRALARGHVQIRALDKRPRPLSHGSEATLRSLQGLPKNLATTRTKYKGAYFGLAMVTMYLPKPALEIPLLAKSRNRLVAGNGEPPSGVPASPRLSGVARATTRSLQAEACSPKPRREVDDGMMSRHPLAVSIAPPSVRRSGPLPSIPRLRPWGITATPVS
jgi:hypothetical protein